MDDVYDSYGIAAKLWLATTNENSYHVTVCGWSHLRRVIERDGLICFQVTVDSQGCSTCQERVSFVKQQLVNHNVRCFWTLEPDDFSLYVTVGPLPEGLSVVDYLSFILQWPVIMYGSSEETQ